MNKRRLSFIQMDIVPGEPEINRNKACEMIKTALQAKNKPDILILPEMWTTAYQLDQLHKISDMDGLPTNKLIAELAEEYRVNIVAGSYASMQNQKIFNTAYVFDRQGNNIANYQKIHLFKLMEEHKHIAPGNRICTFMLDGIKCGIIICYDLRFPELTRRLALEGIKLLFVPAQWPAARLEHWTTLLRARAIENQIFVAAVNRAGADAQAEFAGGSMLISPWGEVLAHANYKEQVITVEIDLGMIEEARQRINILGDRVPHIY